MKNPRCLSICATCPWIKSNQGKPHPAKWYDVSNLTRLWNGIRLAKTPGMICHSTDPCSPDYGGKAGAKPGAELPCGGVLALMVLEQQALEKSRDHKTYAANRRKPLTKRAFLGFIERAVFGGPSEVDNPKGYEIGLPWNQEK